MTEKRLGIRKVGEINRSMNLFQVVLPPKIQREARAGFGIRGGIMW
jgi:hypothetical protein